MTQMVNYPSCLLPPGCSLQSLGTRYAVCASKAGTSKPILIDLASMQKVRLGADSIDVQGPHVASLSGTAVRYINSVVIDAAPPNSCVTLVSGAVVAIAPPSGDDHKPGAGKMPRDVAVWTYSSGAVPLSLPRFGGIFGAVNSQLVTRQGDALIAVCLLSARVTGVICPIWGCDLDKRVYMHAGNVAVLRSGSREIDTNPSRPLRLEFYDLNASVHWVAGESVGRTLMPIEGCFDKVATSVGGEVSIWSVASGQLEVRLSPLAELVDYCSFSLIGDQYLGITPDMIDVFDLSGKFQYSKFPTAGCTFEKVSRATDGYTVVTSGPDGRQSIRRVCKQRTDHF